MTSYICHMFEVQLVHTAAALTYSAAPRGLSSESEKDRQQILYEYHLAPLGGHQGIQRTAQRIKQKYKSKGMDKDIEQYIQKCTWCQKNKICKRNKAPMVISDTPTRPFEKGALDIVGPLTITKLGNKYILTF